VGGKGGGGGRGGEMTQALYAHMNNKTIKKKRRAYRLHPAPDKVSKHRCIHYVASSNLQMP
jgi:hypothetical protein